MELLNTTAIKGQTHYTKAKTKYSIFLEHKEFQPGSYKYVSLHFEQGSQKHKLVFNSGDPILDFHLATDMLTTLPEPSGFCSSSVDNFIMDEPDYDYTEIKGITKIIKSGMSKKKFIAHVSKAINALPKVNRYSRVGDSPKILLCPNCYAASQSYHFSWSACECCRCHKMVNKNDYFLLK